MAGSGNSERDDLIMELRALMIASQDGLPLNNIKRELDEVGGDVNAHRRFGFRTLEDFVRAHPDQFKIRGGVAFAHGRKESAHISSLVAGQRNPKEIRRNTFLTPRGQRHRFSRPQQIGQLHATHTPPPEQRSDEQLNERSTRVPSNETSPSSSSSLFAQPLTPRGRGHPFWKDRPQQIGPLHVTHTPPPEQRSEEQLNERSTRVPSNETSPSSSSSLFAQPLTPRGRGHPFWIDRPQQIGPLHVTHTPPPEQRAEEQLNERSTRVPSNETSASSSSSFAPPFTIAASSSNSGFQVRSGTRLGWLHLAGTPIPAEGEPLQLDRRIEATLESLKSSKKSIRAPHAAFQKNVSTVIVGKSGKLRTLSYIVPLMERLLQMHDSHSAPRGYGPLAIIVCAHWEKASEIMATCKKFANYSVVQGEVHTRIVLACGGSRVENDRMVQEKVVEGSELLVTTSSWLARNVKHNQIVCLERLQFVALEDTDTLLEPPHDESVRELRQACGNFLRRGQRVQWVMTGETWSARLMQMCHLHHECLTIIFKCFIEAARYSGMSSRMMQCGEEDKVQHILEYMESVVQRDGSSRVVVVCRASEEIEIAACAIRAAGWHVIYPQRGPQPFPIDAVLVCSDCDVDETSTCDANIIIHYSLPQIYNVFVRRFTLAADSLTIGLPFTPDAIANPNRPKLRTLILINDSSQDLVPKIINKLNFKSLDENCLEFMKEVRAHQEKRWPLCHMLVGRGRCPRPRNKCHFSHTVRERDCPLPTHQGIAVFQPVNVINGSKFAAQILQTTDTAGNQHKFKDYSDVHRDLQDYFSVSDRPGLGSTDVGQFCAVFCALPGVDHGDNKKCWYRAQIVPHNEHEDQDMKRLYVRLCDFGSVRNSKLKQMLALPDELSPPRVPQMAVIVHIMGIVPCDFDIHWSLEAESLSRSLLSTKVPPNHRWQGRIRFAFDGALVMDNIELKRYLRIIQDYVTVLSPVDLMLKEELALTNPDHADLLAKACEGVIRPIRVIEKRRKIPTPSWAHLEGDLTEVLLATASETNALFFNILKFVNLLADVEEECKREGEKLLGRQYNIHKADLCLAKDSMGDWNRGRIEDLNEDGTVQCFYVDHGDIATLPASFCVPIPGKLITKLPFQAIECRLGGIEHDNPESDTILDALQYNFTDDAQLPCTLLHKVTDERPSFTRGSLYVVNVVNSEGRSFNKMLVDQGQAKPAADAAEFLKDIDVLVATNNCDEDEDDDVEDDDEVEEEEEEGGVVEEIQPDEIEDVQNFDSVAFLRLLEAAAQEDEDIDHGLQQSLNLVKAVKPVVEEQVKASVAKNMKASIPVGNVERNNAEIEGGIAEIETAADQLNDHNADNGAKIMTDEAHNLLPVSSDQVPLPDPTNLQQSSSHCAMSATDDKYLTPRAYWTQDAHTVRFRFEIIGADGDKLRVYAKKFQFQLICPAGQSVYRAELWLYAPVWHENVKITVTPFDVRLMFSKMFSLARAPWPRPYAANKPSSTRFIAEVDDPNRDNYYKVERREIEFAGEDCGDSPLLAAGAESDSSCDIEDLAYN